MMTIDNSEKGKCDLFSGRWQDSKVRVGAMRGEGAVVVEEQAEARPAGCCEVLACEAGGGLGLCLCVLGGLEIRL